MTQIYHIKPVFTAALWGGQQLIDKYHFTSDLVNIGECYNVIALKDHLDCEVAETGEKLSSFYHNNKDLFQCDCQDMPVRAAMACTITPMSVQVHPNNEYALTRDGKLGKPDGVYVIDGEGTVEFGHFAKSRTEFKTLVNEQAWNDLLRYIQVKKGDFLDMPHGTLHALGANMTYIEFSQNADLTYRLYDYDRKQIDPKTGKNRQMHVEKVCECVNIPNAEAKVTSLETNMVDGCEITYFHNEPGVYTCGKIGVVEKGYYQRDQFYYLICIEGSGLINDQEIKGGETILIPSNFGKITLFGNFTLTFLTYLKP